MSISALRSKALVGGFGIDSRSEPTIFIASVKLKISKEGCVAEADAPSRSVQAHKVIQVLMSASRQGSAREQLVQRVRTISQTVGQEQIQIATTVVNEITAIVKDGNLTKEAAQSKIAELIQPYF